MITSTGLSLLVYPALLLAAITPVVLIYLVWQDVRENKLW